MAHKFHITPAANEQFKFDFSYNGEKIFWSENYKQKASARNAIESLKKNAPGAATADLSKDETGSGYRFEIVKSKDQQFFVRFVASNGETMVRTETYKQKASAVNAIESLKKNGPGADVADEA
ncbi:YegP family protein [Devosia sp.]|uniref:YegP family protein n=1 Tax=Devosia sp. TaxID=1871048 RepID=UPI003A598F31